MSAHNLRWCLKRFPLEIEFDAQTSTGWLWLAAWTLRAWDGSNHGRIVHFAGQNTLEADATRALNRIACAAIHTPCDRYSIAIKGRFVHSATNDLNTRLAQVVKPWRRFVHKCPGRGRFEVREDIATHGGTPH